MKYIILDCSTQVVLAQTNEKRVATLLKSVIVDIKTQTILLSRHTEAYNLITNSYITENIFRFHKSKCEPALNVSEETVQKKLLTGVKTAIAET